MFTIDQFDAAASRLAGAPYIRAIRKGLIYMTPLILTGSLALMVLNLPLPAFQDWMLRLFGEGWREVAGAVYTGTFQVMAITEMLAVSYIYAGEEELVVSGQVSQLSVVLTTFAAYMAFNSQGVGVPGMDRSGSTGMFQGLLTAFISVRLFLFLCDKHQARSKLFTNDADAVLMHSLRIFLPALATIVCFALARPLITLCGWDKLVRWVSTGAQELFAGSRGLWGAVLFTIITHVLWFFGLHGTNMLDGAAIELFVAYSEANVELAQAGQAPVHILTKEFFDVFVYLGGCGSTLGLLLALLLINRSNNIQRVTRVSLLPGIFNINEMMVYGLPVVFNPYYFVPFLLSPLLLSFTTYGAMRLGLVPLTVTRVAWTTPVFFSGYVSTGSAAGIVLQALNLALSVVIYLPFIRLYQRHQGRGARQVFAQLLEEVSYIQEARPKALLTRSDEVGTLARMLASEIQSAIQGEDGPLYLMYQPKTDRDGAVVGAEALLRWNHPLYGFISPPAILCIAEEADLDIQLGSWVIRRALQDLQSLGELSDMPFSLSVNLSPAQLKKDPGLVRTVSESAARMAIDPGRLELELTENAAVDYSPETREKLGVLKEMGVGFAIDDFGMGHSSLLYLRDFFANVVKIDKTLVDNIHTDFHRHVVESILQLCAQLEVEVVAEGVEHVDQVEALEALGCHCFQGYYFSKPLTLQDFARYLREHGCAGGE